MTIKILLILTLPVLMPQIDARPDDTPPPTHADVAFGPHERQRFDLWLADSAEPTPLLIHIHGGGFVSGTYKRMPEVRIRAFNEAGISVASIGYRFVRQVKLPAAHEDAVRAVQFLRHHAETYNLDASRFAGSGGSAGAQLCLYLTLHDDFADPDAEDPISRQSSRLLAAGVSGAQTTMDMNWWNANIPGYTEFNYPRDHFFDEMDEAPFGQLVRDISALDLASADDGPVYLRYKMAPDQPVSEVPEERMPGWRIHHARFGVALYERMHALGLEVILSHPGSEENAYGSVDAFLMAKLAPQS